MAPAVWPEFSDSRILADAGAAFDGGLEADRAKGDGEWDHHADDCAAPTLRLARYRAPRLAFGVTAYSARSERGLFVALVGPDGVGKTTVATALAAAVDGPTAYFHFCPLIRKPLQSEPEADTQPYPEKGDESGLALLGWIRLARNVLRMWVGYLVRVKPAVRKGVFVMGDRWAYGYLVQPGALKFYGPAWMARLALRLLPQPDVVINFTAPPQLIRSRKAELSLERIEFELENWKALPVESLITVETTAEPSTIAAGVLGALSR
jgi:energy-coupling factor transporter ATP-binding protein EcfA2